MAIRRLPSTGDAPRNTGVPESLVAGGAADSAGFPWAGRTFDHHGSDFADDDGTTPEVYAVAVSRLRAAVAERDLVAVAQSTGAVLTALSQIRVLVPLVAEAGELGVTPEGKTVEKTQELSIVTVGAPDGRVAMPVFTSVAALQRWNATARPIPVPGPQAALAAAQEGTDIVVIDPGSPETEFGVRRTELEAMALGTPRYPAWADESVRDAFAESAQSDARILSLAIAAADPEHRLTGPELDVVLTVPAELPREQLTELISAVQTVWSQSPVIAELVDSLRVIPRAATS